MNSSRYISDAASRKAPLQLETTLFMTEYAAVVELVKNAYDADSPDVKINLGSLIAIISIQLDIIDRGHGMTRDTVINNMARFPLR